MSKNGLTRRTIDTRVSPERAYLISVATRQSTDKWPAEDSLDELAQLANTAGAEVVGKLVQRLPVPHKKSYLGEGKLQELLSLKNTANYDVVLVDDELTPLQQHTLEEILKVKIIDRVALILDIFAKRAQTHEGKLQVELAQLEYIYPRLAGQWSHLERLGGGIGTRGPGESQLETDRRLIRHRIDRLKDQTEEVRKHRQLYRQRRQKTGIPVIAIVGYTNSGKSTLLNALGKANVLAENKLFATLDPTTRRLMLPDKRTVLLTDTVGFIRKLPPTIVTAFRATLEELDEASLLLHVVDITARNAAEQSQTVENILAELELSSKPRVTALNKIDALLQNDRKWTEEEAINYLAEQYGPLAENTVLISARKKWGLNKLLEIIAQTVPQPAQYTTSL